MRTLDAIGPAATKFAAAPRDAAAPGAPAQPAWPGTALVPIAPARAPDPLGRPARRPLAAFLVHLIATDRQAPQTRSRRRLEPGEAAGHYRATLAAPAAGAALSRSL
jgi:hypothetical protein